MECPQPARHPRSSSALTEASGTNRDKHSPSPCPKGDVSQLCSPGLPREGPGFHSAVGKPFLPQSCNEISRSCCNASAPTARRLPQAHTGDFLREKEKDSRQGRNSWIAGTPLPGWSPPCGSPGRQHSAARGKTAFAASPGAMEGIFCSCPNQASLPNKAETGEAAGASGRFACVCRENPNQHLGQQTQPRALQAPSCWGG